MSLLPPLPLPAPSSSSSSGSSTIPSSSSSSSIAPFFMNLPHEIQIKIFSFLEPDKIFSVYRMVCKTWSSFTDPSPLNSNSPSVRNNLLCSMMSRRMIIYSGSQDLTIKVLDGLTGECLKSLTGHADDVRCLTRVKDQLVSGSFDGVLKLWNPWTGECVKTIQKAHNGCINEIEHLPDNTIVTTSADGRIKHWTIDFELITEFVSSAVNWVNGLVIIDFYIYTSNSQGHLEVWDAINQKKLNLYQITSSHIWKMKTDGRRIFTADYAGACNSWDLHGNLIANYSGDNTRVIYGLDVNSNHMAFAVGGQVHLWDISFPTTNDNPTENSTSTTSIYNDTFIGKWAAHETQICAIKLTEDRVITGSFDFTVKVWDFSGKMISSYTGHKNHVWCFYVYYHYFM